MLRIFINTESPIPLYRQIVDQVERLVNENQLKPGEQIPAVREMARWLQVNPSTVARAYYDLKKSGVVATSRRRGTIILGNNTTLAGTLISEINALDMADEQVYDKKYQRTQKEGLAAIFTLHLARWQVQRFVSQTH
jgi:DNA-binding transcriptional regulator YhcF (GntR family)